jgi:hypothetical protein
MSQLKKQTKIEMKRILLSKQWDALVINAEKAD